MPCSGQVGDRAHAGEEQQLGRIERTAREDHLPREDPLRAPPPGDLDADRPRPLEEDLRHECPGPDLEVPPLAHDRVQVGPRRRQPPAPMDVAVEWREAFLAIPVDVVGQRIAGLLGALEEGREQRIGRGAALQDERAVVASPRIVGRCRERRLHPLEVGQAMGVVPGRHAGIGGPPLEVERVAALEDLPVDAAAPTEDLAAGVVDPPAVHERLWLGLVLPVVEAAADREGERRRHVDERVDAPIGATGLEDEDPRRGSADSRFPSTEPAEPPPTMT